MRAYERHRPRIVEVRGGNVQLGGVTAEAVQALGRGVRVEVVAIPAVEARQRGRDSACVGLDMSAVKREDGDPGTGVRGRDGVVRSEEHTSELQSRQYLVCRLLLEKKKT